MPIASTPEQHAMQEALRDWAKRTGTTGLVRGRETSQAEPVDLDPLWQLLSPDDLTGSLADVAVAVEQLAASLAPGAIMPALLASLIVGTPQTAAAVALDPGTLAANPDGTVTGRTGPVLGASATTTLIASTTSNAWFMVRPGAPGLAVTPLAALDFSRELATFELNAVTVTPLPTTTTQVRDLAVTLAAAEAAGVAAWCTATATEYAKTRKQFGRIIAEFQAVKHLCAVMHCRTERAAAVAWGAATAAPGEQHTVAAATAGAIALDDAVANAEDCIQVLGGIGFTWEHDAHLYLRRAITLRQLFSLRPSPRPRPRPPADSCATSLDPGRFVRHESPSGESPSGGSPSGGSPSGAAGAPASRDIGVGAWAISAIRGHGSEAQRDRFIEATRVGRLTWCQLFSEPEAGSDLAGLKTRAVRDEAAAGWRLTGQKVWTSLARQADWAICLARTDPDVPKHQGLTYFVVDMRQPGIEIRPLREITGRSMFNEVFLDDVFVADDCVVGSPGDGWRVAMSTLATERERLGGDDPVVTLLELRDAHPAVRKLIGVERRQARARDALASLGPAGAASDTPQAEEYLLTRCLSIAGGTTQVLLNQVAERILGLPR